MSGNGFIGKTRVKKRFDCVFISSRRRPEKARTEYMRNTTTAISTGGNDRVAKNLAVGSRTTRSAVIPGYEETPDDGKVGFSTRQKFCGHTRSRRNDRPARVRRGLRTRTRVPRPPRRVRTSVPGRTTPRPVVVMRYIHAENRESRRNFDRVYPSAAAAAVVSTRLDALYDAFPRHVNTHITYT